MVSLSLGKKGQRRFWMLVTVLSEPTLTLLNLSLLLGVTGWVTHLFFDPWANPLLEGDQLGLVGSGGLFSADHVLDFALFVSWLFRF
jgi:hypothetical protein